MLYSFVFHCNFSNPNRITKRSKSRNRRLCDFFWYAKRRKLAFVSGAVSKKTDSAQAECRFASVLMMARGGREKASQRLNPNRKTIIICPTFVRYVMQEIARIGYVVSRCKAPYAIPTDKTEVLGMVVLVVAY